MSKQIKAKIEPFKLAIAMLIKFDQMESKEAEKYGDVWSFETYRQYKEDGHTPYVYDFLNCLSWDCLKAIQALLLIGRGDFDEVFEVDQDAEPEQLWDDDEKTYTYQQPLVQVRPSDYDSAFSCVAEDESTEGRDELINYIDDKPLSKYLPEGYKRLGLLPK